MICFYFRHFQSSVDFSWSQNEYINRMTHSHVQLAHLYCTWHQASDQNALSFKPRPSIIHYLFLCIPMGCMGHHKSWQFHFFTADCHKLLIHLYVILSLTCLCMAVWFVLISEMCQNQCKTKSSCVASYSMHVQLVLQAPDEEGFACRSLMRMIKRWCCIMHFFTSAFASR